MATKLTRPVKREMISFPAKGKHSGKPVIVELLPGDEISFRVKGTRATYSIYLGHCFRLAQIQTLESDYVKRMEEYKRKKKAGYKNLRTPKRYALPFNKLYFKTLNQ